MKADNYFDSGFEDADEYEDVQGLVETLEIQHVDPKLLCIRKKMYEKIKVAHGDEVLEVGCGLGKTIRDIADIVGNKVKLTGLDKSGALLAEASRRTDNQHQNIFYRKGDANSLPFSDNLYAFVCAERVLMHTRDPKQVLAEMVRTLQEGGTIAITEPDLSSVEIYPDYNDISKQVVQQWCEYSESPAIGRHLLKYFQDLGLKNIEILVHAYTMNDFETFERIRSLTKLVKALEGNKKIPSEDASTYLQGLRDAGSAGKFIYYVNIYSISAQK